MGEQVHMDKWFLPLTSIRIGYSPPHDSPTLLLIPGCEYFYILVNGPCLVPKPGLWRRLAAKLEQIRRLLLLKLAVFWPLMLNEENQDVKAESPGGRLSLIKVSWKDVRKINVEVKYLTDSSLALETKIYKWEFKTTHQAASIIASSVPETERDEVSRNLKHLVASLEKALGRKVEDTDSTGVPGNINPEGKTEGCGLILLTFDNPSHLSELKEIFTIRNSEGDRLRSLVESGIPSWAIFMQQSSLFYHLYRPWMPQLVKVGGLLIWIVTVLITFHNYYDTLLLKMFVKSSMRYVRGLFKLVASPVIMSSISYFRQAIECLLVLRKPLIKLMRFAVSIWMYCLSVLPVRMVELIHKMVNYLVQFCSNTFEVIKEFSVVISTSLKSPLIVSTAQMMKNVFVAFIRFSASCCNDAFRYLWSKLLDVLNFANWCIVGFSSLWPELSSIWKITSWCSNAFLYLWSILLDILKFRNRCIVALHSLWQKFVDILKITSWCNDAFLYLWSKLLDILNFRSWLLQIQKLEEAIYYLLKKLMKEAIYYLLKKLMKEAIYDLLKKLMKKVICDLLKKLWHYVGPVNQAARCIPSKRIRKCCISMRNPKFKNPLSNPWKKLVW